jgi:pyridinium-3,5-bisthiocarboxylic acid mononucleotide nickel chelatase
VGVAAALHLLGVSEVHSAALRIGTGEVRTRHGLLPVPAPATIALLRGMAVAGCDIAGETVTPTGAALLAAAGCRFGGMPPMTVRGTGYGAGTRDVAGRPNVLPATLGTSMTAGEHRPMLCLETTVDDVTGEVLGYLTSVLLDSGAADVWTVPGVGKKNRPVHVITVLCTPDLADELTGRLLAETGSLGVRRAWVERLAVPRHMLEVTVEGHAIQVKCGPNRCKPEHDDLVRAARATGVTLRELAERALAAARERHLLNDPRTVDRTDAAPLLSDARRGSVVPETRSGITSRYH